jgi:exodeoxyribonuclease-3
MLKISSYNINGVRAAHRKGFIDWVNHSNPDIICIQELRAEEAQLPEEIKNLKYHKYIVSAAKKGYSGVSIFSKKEALSVNTGMGIDWIDTEGRVITAVYDNYRIVSAYFPSGATGDARQEIKMKFLDAFIVWAKQFVGNSKPTIICGDFNICHLDIDIHNPEKQHKTSGFLPEERQWVSEFIDAGFEDLFRKIHPQKKEVYSWWSYRAGSKGKNKGWRIDYQMGTLEIARKATEAFIEKEWDISDHAPVSVIYKL